MVSHNLNYLTARLKHFWSYHLPRKKLCARVSCKTWENLNIYPWLKVICVLKMVILMVVIFIWIVPLDPNQRITMTYILKIKGMKLLPTDLKWKIIDYRTVLSLMLCYLYPHLINIPIQNAIINIITFWWMVTFKNQATHQFQCWIHFMLHQKTTKDVYYLVQYMRISSIQILSKTQSRSVRREMDVMKSQIKLLDHKIWHYVILEYFLKYKSMENVLPTMDKKLLCTHRK